MASNDPDGAPEFLENTQSRITVYEGRRNHVYLDSRNIPTVGIGFKLNRGDATAVFTAVGANYAAVSARRSNLTVPQVDKLFASDMKKAVQ